MAMSHNYVCAMGYLGADPEIRKLDRGGEVANFSVAATERWGGSGRDAQEHTEWFRCTVYGGTPYGDGLIDVVDKYLRKGDPCLIEGKLRTRKYQDKDGVDRYATEVIVSKVQLLGAAPGGADDRGGGDRRDSRGGGGGRDDRGRDDRGGGRDDRGGGRREEPRGRGREEPRGRDEGRGGRDDRGGGRDDRRDTRGGGRDDRRGDTRGSGQQVDNDLDDSIPF